MAILVIMTLTENEVIAVEEHLISLERAVKAMRKALDHATPKIPVAELADLACVAEYRAAHIKTYCTPRL